MDRISIDILSLIAAAAASSGPEIDLSTVYDVWTLHDKPKFPGSGKPKENSLASCAAVSREWQLAFEPFTFRTLVLSPKRIVQAERQGYLTPRRLGCIRNLAVPITFPLPWPWDVPIVFAQVGEWPPPSEFDDAEVQKTIDGNESANANGTAWEDVEGSEGTNDEDLDNDGYMDVEDDMQPPEERDFAKSLPLLPQGVLDFELKYSRRVPRDHSHAPASIVPPGGKHDLLSQALFNFSQRENLLRFSAKGSFDLNILGTSEKALAARNGWPMLETYDVGFLAITPSGQWLARVFTDNPNTDSFREERWGPPSEQQRSCLSLFDTNEFRGPIEPDYAHRLVCTAGRAASHMPRLRRMDINVGVVGGYKVCYTSKKVNPCMRIVGKKLQPPTEELLRVWRRVAQDRYQQFGLEWNDTVKTNKRKMLFS
ncbi:hypothetical protein NW768_009625 [Fusarium equiseti]|uniref:DUF6546 domain-containing protein n=1 Tax=Fusarium equiseti TaxID=61235 RepID=A0ABQ8R2M9_FUSEQ|nr:hypothetical protein NW768_009625 [Fusarium equiseti]